MSLNTDQFHLCKITAAQKRPETHPIALLFTAGFLRLLASDFFYYILENDKRK